MNTLNERFHGFIIRRAVLVSDSSGSHIETYRPTRQGKVACKNQEYPEMSIIPGTRKAYPLPTKSVQYRISCNPPSSPWERKTQIVQSIPTHFPAALVRPAIPFVIPDDTSSTTLAVALLRLVSSNSSSPPPIFFTTRSLQALTCGSS